MPNQKEIKDNISYHSNFGNFITVSANAKLQRKCKSGKMPKMLHAGDVEHCCSWTIEVTVQIVHEAWYVRVCVCV